MLRQRLVTGTVLAALMGGVLLADDRIGSPFPFLLVSVLLLGLLSTGELVRLLPTADRPRVPVAVGGTLLVIAANWLPAVTPVPPWHPPLFAFVGVLLAAFLVEMRSFTGPGDSTRRVVATAFTAAYLGLLPSFLVQLRWLPDVPASLALAATVFVPKVCDIGAYFTGRAVGRTLFTPVLSPKKTWEGVLGGVAAAVGTAVGVSFLGPLFRHGLLQAVAFGLLVGWAGILGDLAESMIKRDALAKDAAASVPGFGGMLDVVDSVLFAAPVAYLVLAV
jgi:phosphatidate cytidylyltransferase